ncbi:MAG: hypothetical protein CNLJKLNK_00776 [Holosporales bacterium]
MKKRIFIVISTAIICFFYAQKKYFENVFTESTSSEKASSIEERKHLKIAVQIFGHVRTFEKCFPSLKKYVLDVYDCDVFMHIWDTLAPIKTHHNYDSKIKNIYLSEEYVNKIKEKYNPKVLKIDTQNFINDEKPFLGMPHLPQKGIKYLSYSMKSVNSLRIKFQEETNQQYDGVLYIRPDIMINEDLHLEKAVESFALYNYCYHFMEKKVKKMEHLQLMNNEKEKIIHAGTSDVAFFMSPTSVNIISTIYENFDLIFVESLKFLGLEKRTVYSEEPWMDYLHSKGIVSKYFPGFVSIERP